MLASADAAGDPKNIDSLPKVAMLEDDNGNFHIKNLSMHPVDTEEEALDLLFYGETNRAWAETSMNLVSQVCSFVTIQVIPHSVEIISITLRFHDFN